MQVCARRSRAGFATAAAVALMCAGVIAGTDAAGGQPGVEISVGEAELSPSEVAAGETVTVRSVGFACASGPDDHTGLVWAVFPRGEFEWVSTSAGSLPMPSPPVSASPTRPARTRVRGRPPSRLLTSARTRPAARSGPAHR